MTERKFHVYRPDCADGNRSKDSLGNWSRTRKTEVREKKVPGNAQSFALIYVNTKEEGAALCNKNKTESFRTC